MNLPRLHAIFVKFRIGPVLVDAGIGFGFDFCLACFLLVISGQCPRHKTSKTKTPTLVSNFIFRFSLQTTLAVFIRLAGMPRDRSGKTPKREVQGSQLDRLTTSGLPVIRQLL